MASISPRGRFWRVRVRVKGVTRTKTFDTRREAEEWAAQEEADIAASLEPKARELTCPVLFDRYAKEVSPKKGGARWEIIRLRALSRSFPGLASALDGPALADWRDERLKEVSAAAVNRDLNLIGAVFTRAIKEWRLGLTINPVHQIQRPPQPASRTRRVTDAELAIVVLELGWDREKQPGDIRKWIAWTACLAIETAMRKSELLNMSWEHVHERHVHLPRTKNGRARNVPLSSRARALLGLLERGDGVVIPVQSGTFDAYWRQAVAGTGLDDLHFHDLRREATTRMAPKFRDALELSRVTGHSDIRSLGVYFHPDVESLADKLD